jgi:hypothetical protein
MRRLLGSLAALAIAAACQSSNNNGGTAATHASHKGEACQTTADCVSGLGCVPSPSAGGGGVCVTNEFNVAVTAKECAIIQCQTPQDCCTPILQGSQCSLLAAECADAGTQSNSYCQQYQQLCLCDGSRFNCSNNQCQSHCNTDFDCYAVGGNASRCAGGRCVQCIQDTNCPNAEICVDGACMPPCQSDGDCPSFNRCTGGRCTDSGCQTDRECIAATRNVEAKCGTDGKCIVPCQTDLECGNPKAYSFYSCVNSQCTYTGCQSDKDCELYLTGGSDAGLPFGSRTHVVCRDKMGSGPSTTFGR